MCPSAFIESVFFSECSKGGLHFTSCSIGGRFCLGQDGTFAFELIGGLPLPCLCGPRAEAYTCGLDIFYLCEDLGDAIPPQALTITIIQLTCAT